MSEETVRCLSFTSLSFGFIFVHLSFKNQFAKKKESKQSDSPVSTHKIIINLLQGCNETYEHGPQEITR